MSRRPGLLVTADMPGLVAAAAADVRGGHLGGLDTIGHTATDAGGRVMPGLCHCAAERCHATEPNANGGR